MMGVGHIMAATYHIYAVDMFFFFVWNDNIFLNTIYISYVFFETLNPSLFF